MYVSINLNNLLQVLTDKNVCVQQTSNFITYAIVTKY